MTRMKALTFTAALVLAVVGCAQFAGVHTLRGTDAATTDLAPDAKAYAGKRPGSQPAIVRTFNEQPPLVPHAIENFDEITVGDNQCLECHGPANFAKKSAPKVGDSHLLAAGSPDLRLDRYQCNSCHVPQVDAKPLVSNTFVGTPVAPRK